MRRGRARRQDGLLLVAALLIAIIGCDDRSDGGARMANAASGDAGPASPLPPAGEEGVGDDRAPRDEEFVPKPELVSVDTWIEGLRVPWSIVFTGSRDALVSERPGSIRRISGGRLLPEAWATLDVRTGGEGGLMGLALHPDYPREPYVYAMHTYSDASGRRNRVVRLRDEGEQGTIDSIVIDGIPGASVHDGGRIAFGPDGMLYICTGDAAEPSASQNLDSLAGKILRLTPSGEIPADNPFRGLPVYAYGLRNPQGLAWHPSTGDLVASDHGPSGERGLRAHDEINLVRPGGNYGWPEVVGASDNPDFVDPLVVWPDRAVPPAGIAFDGEVLFVATLASEALVRIPLRPSGSGLQVGRIERWFARSARDGVYGRLRSIERRPDGAFYILTSNRDGRGTPREGDDRILRMRKR